MVIPNSTVEIIHELIDEHGMTASKIAEKVGLSTSSLYRILQGENSSIETDRCILRFYLRKALGINVDDTDDWKKSIRVADFKNRSIKEKAI
jgi:predicted transcriptional regulator